MLTRRRLVLTLGAGALAAPFITFAQTRARIPRVGILATGSQSGGVNLYDTFAQAMKDLGYVEGKSIVFERRFADGDLNKLPALVADLLKNKVDVIFAPNSPAVHAVKQGGGTTPVVFAAVNDPVGRGFAASLAQPGGLVTGVMSVAPGVSAKRLGLLKEAFSKIKRVAVAIAREPDVANQVAAQISEMQQAGKANGMEVLSIEIRSRKAFDDAADVLRKWRADGMSCLDSAVNFYNRDVLIEFAAKMKLPAIYTSREYVEAGGLMSYGANAEWNYRRAATYVDKILKGAKPGELPVETPGKFELAVNSKTAGALGVQFPPALLEKTDRIIG